MNLAADDGDNDMNIPISKFIQVHKLDTIPQTQHQFTDELPESWYDRHSEDLKYLEEEKLCYLMHTSEIFPFDVDFDSENEQYSTLSRDRVLRPEMISMYEY